MTHFKEAFVGCLVYQTMHTLDYLASTDDTIRQTQPLWLNSGTHYFCIEKLDINSYSAASCEVYDRAFLCYLERAA